MKTQAELAHRIRSAKPADADGRYDMASKVEVKAYLAEEVGHAVVAAFEEITRRYEARIAELELSLWQRIKRLFSQRKVGMPPEFAAKYGSGQSMGKTELMGTKAAK